MSQLRSVIRPRRSYRKHPDFTPNYQWNTTRLGYLARPEAPANVRVALALMLLGADKDFQHLRRQFTSPWIVSVHVTKDNVDIAFYDPAVVDDPHAVWRSHDTRADQAVFLEIDKFGDMVPVTDERRLRALQSHPECRSDRRLRPTEINMLDSLELSFGIKPKEPTPVVVPEETVDEPERPSLYGLTVQSKR